MSIKVCDAIMGSGKSSAAINYMNQRPNEKFIYITPYLEEAKRIRESCPALNFKEPSNKIPEFEFRKYKHTIKLLDDGENITSTHSMFLRYSDEMVDLIRDRGYTLIIDESADILREAEIYKEDLRVLKDAGYVTYEDGIMKISPGFDYNRGKLEEIMSLARGNRLIETTESDTDLKGTDSWLYWIYSKDIITAFKDVFVLSYLFEAQMMKYYFDINNLEYSMIGITRDEKGGYYFSDKMAYIPEYTKDLSHRIHIFNNDKLNAIGDNRHALSHNWYRRYPSSHKNKVKLKNNVYNFFMNHHRHKSVKRRIWASFKNGESLIRDKGFYYNNIAFNTKATNDYRDRDVLAYLVNIFMEPQQKNYLYSNGVDVLEDRYALSIMVQWIWRSAIRDGKEIWIYVPSKRMRTLLENWIEEVEELYKLHN